MWRFKLKQAMHSSWQIAVIASAFVIGVTCAQWWNEFNAISWLLCGVVLIALVAWKKSVYLLPLLVLGGLLIGLWRGSLTQSELTVYDRYYDTTVQLTGKVSDDPEAGQYDKVQVRLVDITHPQKLPGTVWVSGFTKFDIKRGDIITIQGELAPGFGSFAAGMYRAEFIRVQRPQPGDVARQVRDWFAEGVKLAIADPEASLGLGYLLGQRRALPPELDQALLVAGLTHVVVASGYNLTILVRFARRLFDNVSKYLAVFSASTMIVAFIMITGMSPSMSRAGLVAGLALAVWYYGRKFHPLVLLPFAAAVTLLINPSYAWGDLGWQLSFMAFAGVMIMAPLMQAYFFGSKKPGTVRQILGETMSAQIATLPILVLAFGQYSNIAVVANLLILPLVPLAMLLTFFAGLGALLMPAFATLFGFPAQGLLAYMTNTAEYLAALPWAQGELEITPWHMLGAYIVIISLCVYMQYATKYNLRDSNIVE